MALVSVVVPVYNEAEMLPLLVQRLTSMAASVPENDFEFVFVDDGSRDTSFDILQRLAAGDARVRIVKLSRNFGSTAAIRAGLAYTSGECVVVISADLQDPPELIPAMLQEWANGAKVVLAARLGREDPMLTRLFANAYYWLFRRLALKDMPKGGTDFVLVDRKVADLLVHLHERNTYLMGLLLWMGFERKVIYYQRQKREKGKSHWTFAMKIKHFIDGFVSFTYSPIRIISLLGIMLACGGFVYASVLILYKLFQDTIVEGWTSLMVVFLIISGVQLITLGVLGEYLWRNIEETRDRPRFIVEQQVGFKDDEVSP